MAWGKARLGVNPINFGRVTAVDVNKYVAVIVGTFRSEISNFWPGMTWEEKSIIINVIII